LEPDGGDHDPAAYLEGPIDYGPSFRGVTRVERLDAQGATVCLRLPAALREGARNPLAYDLATHALLVWLQARHAAGCLPSRVARIVWPPASPPASLDAQSAGGSLTARVAIRDIDAERVVADLALFDDSGRALLWMSGFEGVVVDRAHPLSARAAARRSA
jgi:hypothetical protein